jgi:hypothetical protein
VAVGRRGLKKEEEEEKLRQKFNTKKKKKKTASSAMEYLIRPKMFCQIGCVMHLFTSDSSVVPPLT